MAGPIRISIIANGRQARAEAARTASSYERFGRTVSRTSKALGAVFAVAQLGRAAVAVGKVGASYVDSLNKIQALTGTTDAQMSKLADKVEGQASAFAKFGQTTGDAARGMVELAKSGLSARKSLAAVRGTMLLAKAGELEVADASELVANTLNTFGLQARKATKIANSLANAANISSADVRDVAESFKYVAPLAAKANVTVDQTNALLAELANAGIKASQAGTSLRKFLLSLQAPTGAAKEAIDGLGVAVYDAEGNMRPIGSLIRQLNAGLSDLTAKGQNKALRDIFGLTGITGAQVILKGGVEGLREYTAGVQRAGAAADLAASASRGLAGTIGSLKAQLTSAAQSFYRVYSPAVDSALQKVVEFVTEHKREFKAALAGAGVALTAFAAGLAVVAVATAGPLTAATAAVIGLGAALGTAYDRSETFRSAVRGAADVLQNRIIPAITAFGGYLRDTTLPAVQRVAQVVGQRLQPVVAQAAETFRNDIRPALAQVNSKFQEWQPGLRRAAEVTGRLVGRLLVLNATIVGKVAPAIIRLTGVMSRTQIPATLKVIGVGIKYVQIMISIDRAIVRAAQASARFSAAVRQKMGEALDYIRSIPGRITGALGDLGGLLTAAGSALIGGFISGITSRIGDVEGTLRGLTSKLTSWKGPPAKDKRLLRPAGRMLMDGLVKGIQDGSTGVQTVLERITRLIEKRYDGTKRKAILRSLRDERAALLANGKAQDRVNRMLEKAEQRYTDLRRKADDFARSIKTGFQTYGGIIGLGTTGGGTAVTLPALLSQLGARVSVAQQLSAVIASLRGKLNKTSLKQLLDQAASGDLEGALATAQAIASGGAGAIAQLNDLTQQIAQAGEKLGLKMRREFFGHGLEIAEGTVKGLEKRQHKLDRIAERLAKEFLRQAGLGSRGGTSTSGKGRTVVVTSTPRTPALDAFMTARTATGATSPTVTVQVELTAQQLSEIEKGRKIQVSLDAYHGAGGRAKVRTP